jgi:hypothetical protein
MFDHYHFRLTEKQAKPAKKKLMLMLPSTKPSQEPWWAEYYTDPRKIRDRELFA